MPKKRKNELSAASVVLMCLVILIHLLSEAFGMYERDSVHFAITSSVHRLSSFAVQGFIFLSGVKMFLTFREDLSYPRFLLGRLKRVVLPYILVFSLFFVYHALRGEITPSAALYFCELLSGGLVGHFYFVPVICQLYLLAPLWRLLYKKADPILSVTVSLLLTVIFSGYLPQFLRLTFGVEFGYNARLFTSYAFYFVSGIFAAKYYESFTEFLVRKRRCLLILWAAVGLIDCAAVYAIYRGIYYTFGDILHMLYCISAILALMSQSLSVGQRKFAGSRIFSLVDRASYSVYLIHPMFIFIVNSALTYVGIHSVTLRLLIKTPSVFVLSVGFAVGITAVTERIRGRAKK